MNRRRSHRNAKRRRHKRIVRRGGYVPMSEGVLVASTLAVARHLAEMADAQIFEDYKARFGVGRTHPPTKDEE